eukprot:g28017.t1
MAIDHAMGAEAGSSEATVSHRCGHCGEDFASRNALFKHLAAKCDPLAAKERILFTLGYLGSRYRCSALQNERDEEERKGCSPPSAEKLGGSFAGPSALADAHGEAGGEYFRQNLCAQAFCNLGPLQKFGPVPEDCTSERVHAMLAEQQLVPHEVILEPGRGHVQVKMAEGEAQKALARLQGLRWQNQLLSAAPYDGGSSTGGKFVSQRGKGLRSYHNFMSPAPAPGDASAMRALLHCSAMGLQMQQRRGIWTSEDWTAVHFCATDFGPQQVRRMAGALVATSRGSEAMSYIARCFEPSPMNETISLDSFELGPVETDWRPAAQVDMKEAAAMKQDIEQRVRTEALEPWKEPLFVQKAPNILRWVGRCAQQRLSSAAERGDVLGARAAVADGARVDGRNEYGQRISPWEAAALRGHRGDFRHLCVSAWLDLRKASPTDRCYFDDVSGWLTGALDRAISVAALPDASSAVSRVRFLIYPEPGGCLPAHVDLPRTDKKGLRTTYTFLLYLSDCSSGGETTFLEALESDRELAASGGVMPGERRTLARVSPRRNRLLLMPHACPHLAAPIIHAPKVLVRGEVLPPTCMPHSSAVTVAPEPVQQDASSQLVELGDGVHSCWLDEKIDFERRTNVRCVWFSAHIG